MSAIAYSSTSTTIGENISTNGTLTVLSNSNLATTTISGGDLIVDTDTVIVDNDNNRIGIGTTNPNNRLTIYDASKAGLEFSGASGSTYKWTIGLDMADGGKFKIASSTALGTTDRLVIDGNGNVGIGTTSPATTLDVNGIIKTQPRSTATCNTNAAGGIYFDSDDNHFYGCNGSAWIQLDNL